MELVPFKMVLKTFPLILFRYIPKYMKVLGDPSWGQQQALAVVVLVVQVWGLGPS